MIKFPDYLHATNMAYWVLRAFSAPTLPVSVLPIICGYPNLRAVPYSKICNRFGLSYSELLENNVSDKGYTAREGEQAIIYYNDYTEPETTRFTLAHELGHYILRHVEESLANEREANCFARNLLCPIPVTDAFKLDNVLDCSDVFDVSIPAAEVVLDKQSLDRMNIRPELYLSIAQHYDLNHLTKEEQIKRCPARFLRAVSDFAPFTINYHPILELDTATG